MFQEICSAVPAYIIYYTFSIVLSLVSKSSPPLYHQSPVADNTDCKVIHLRPWLVGVYDVVEGKGNSCNYITCYICSKHLHDKKMSIFVKFIGFIAYRSFAHCHYFRYLGELASFIVTTWQNSQPKKECGTPQKWGRKWVLRHHYVGYPMVISLFVIIFRLSKLIRII